MNAHDLGDYSKSCLSQIGSIEPELQYLRFYTNVPEERRKKKEERRKKKEEEEEEEEEDLEFAPIDRRVATVKINLMFSNLFAMN